MLCPSCNVPRPADASLCLHCGATSPLIVGTTYNYGATSSSTSSANPTNPWNNQPGTSTQQGNDNSLWAQIMAPQALHGQAPMGMAANNPPSLLPVPYQPSTVPRQQPAENALIPVQDSSTALIPAPPAEIEMVHIAPMYTKPRAIIPRYRAISGLLSVLIVSILLCTGAGYYAKASGQLSFIHRITGDYRPDSIKPSPTAPVLPPNTQSYYGPASTIITSATTASKVDRKTNLAYDSTATFKVGQFIYLTYSVNPKSPGAITFKWYTNNMLYQTSQPVAIHDARNGLTVMQYSQPVEGMVELYWNNQLAIRLYFIVQ